MCVRLRPRVPLGLGRAADRCRNKSSGAAAEEAATRGECAKPLDAGGFHALVCLAGGLVIRRHHTLRDLWAGIGREAGYASATENLEPSWTRARTNAEDEVEVEQARLDCRFSGPPADPLVYGDVVVSHPEGAAWLAAAAVQDGATAEGAAKGKHSRYPAFAPPGGRLVPLSVETFGRWGSEALKFLRALRRLRARGRRSWLSWVLGGRGCFSGHGTPAYPWPCRRPTPLAFSRPAEFGERRTSSGGTAGRAGRRTSRTCCATRRPPPPLGTSMDRRGRLALASRGCVVRYDGRGKRAVSCPDGGPWWRSNGQRLKRMMMLFVCVLASPRSVSYVWPVLSCSFCDFGFA